MNAEYSYTVLSYILIMYKKILSYFSRNDLRVLMKKFNNTHENICTFKNKLNK
jgi:hypothetical protein